ncbi:MAG: E3 ubiquitin ligase family protein [Candidatus Aminicenantes bacterium]|nr:E3 ubiquitin ligase family protein [Candidatus Aminicenantes bacterium]
MQPEHVLIIGGVSLLAGLICHLFYNKNKKLLEEMWAVDTYGAKDLRRMVKGGFEATVEVFGTVFCENPLVSLAANIPCCYFFTSVSRQDCRTQTVTSGSGSSRRTHTQTDYVWVEEMTKKKSTLFKIRDKSGDTLVDPTGASIDTDTVVDEIVSYREPWFEQFVCISDTGKYRIKESVFRPEGFAYVLGQAFPTGDGDALIKYPKKGYMDPKKKFFLISRKSEKEMTQKKQRVSRVLGVVRAVFFLAVLYSLLSYFGIAPGL